MKESQVEGGGAIIDNEKSSFAQFRRQWMAWRGVAWQRRFPFLKAQMSKRDGVAGVATPPSSTGRVSVAFFVINL